jgi:formylglycine-generating enzyme required for sulfatase activity
MSDILGLLREALQAEFTIERELGGGGMSQVFLAEERGLARRVVIKVLPPELAGSVSLERFHREVQMAASLQHPHIVPVLRTGIAADLLYYTMPFVAGESLRSRLQREGRVPPAEAASILRDVADALSYAHRHGVVHRDIKPDNILLADGHAVVTDFGVARALSEAVGPATLTASGLAIGTPLYMAPEQAAGDPATDHRADIYALGVVGYEMAAGAPPFTGPTPQAILAAKLTEAPTPLLKKRPDTPPALAAIVGRCLARRPADRFQTAEELLVPLAAVATPSGGVAAARLGRGLLLRRLARRGAPWIAAGLAALLLVVWQVGARRRAGEVLVSAMPAAQAGRFDEVYAILARTGADVSSRRLKPLADRVVGWLAIETTPAGARAEVVRVTPLGGFATRRAEALGRTPLRAPLVAGEYLVRLRGPAGALVELIVAVVARRERQLARTILSGPAAGTFVAVGRAVGPPGGSTSAAPFAIGRTEVTNAEFQRFVAAGGYRDSTLWPDTLLVDGVARPRVLAMNRFVDGTGVPGPRFWSGGVVPAGQEHHPVVGVSWYEAAAYARWSGARLPTEEEWYRAALGDDDRPFPWGRDAATAEQRANFGGVGTAPVGTNPLSVSPFGAHDMAGNVREWVADPGAGAGKRLAVGGSWQEPSYGFERNYPMSLGPWSRTDAIGFRLASEPGHTGGP